MKATCIILIIVFVVSGCTSTFVVGPSTEHKVKDRITYDRFNKRVNAPIPGSAEIVFLDSTKLTGKNFRADVDSIFFVDSKDSLRSVRTSTIRSIHRKDRWGGFVEGFILGGVIGASVGGVGGVITLISSHDRDASLFASFMIAGSAVAGGMIGAVVGSYTVINTTTSLFKIHSA